MLYCVMKQNCHESCLVTPRLDRRRAHSLEAVLSSFRGCDAVSRTTSSASISTSASTGSVCALLSQVSRPNAKSQAPWSITAGIIDYSLSTIPVICRAWWIDMLHVKCHSCMTGMSAVCCQPVHRLSLACMCRVLPGWFLDYMNFHCALLSQASRPNSRSQTRWSCIAGMNRVYCRIRACPWACVTPRGV